MERFKLIREYPGSPKLGNINTDDDFEKVYAPSNYPEFWEKVEEKNYEILSYKSDNPLFIYEKNTYGFFKAKNHPTFYCKNAMNEMSIYSIKRLSDGVVFAINDAVVHKNTGSAGQIHKFHILSNGIWFKTSGFDVPMCDITDKVKVRLFQTFDGVDVFEGDLFYWISQSTNLYCETSAKKGTTQVNKVEYLKFSTKKAAQAYINENKPKYSEKDMLDFVESVGLKNNYANEAFNNWKLKN